MDLAAPALPATFADQHQPCTSPPAVEGVSSIVVRLSNPLAEGLNNTNRVENEVAALYLTRQSMEAAGLGRLVPAVYAWAPCRYPIISDEMGFGWIMFDFRRGSDLDTQFPNLALGEAKAVVEQIADILAAVQRANIPATVTKFGALTMETAGTVVSGQMPLLHGGPWDTYEEVWLAKLILQLQQADESPLLKGWVAGGLRERLDKFMREDGVKSILEGTDASQRVLTHGDLSMLLFHCLSHCQVTFELTKKKVMNNILYDGETKRITGLLDFDWSSVTHPCDEYLTGLWDIGGGIHQRIGQFQHMVLSGDFSVQPKSLSDEDIRKWEVAKAWNAAVTIRDVIRPSSIVGVDRIHALKNLEDLLCPFELTSEVMLKRITDENKERKKKEAEAKLWKWLETYDTL